ncbi:PEP-CTERM sorting domain-containing protein [Gemmata sp. G18]|uniref:PEP-CTERM sorting domain-containing protein n=1 Tax=Gemmata palustris TaxID=2822762 RepID=A0ABS5BSQ5_9BACT|nr:PEP-CTERM sorting domain-containing protein [Gemmata palustris]MBP3956763.1 PEP-CTERM sorting domain-containing protein [Gemmata palustris]
MLLPRPLALGFALVISAAFTAPLARAGLLPLAVTVTPEQNHFRWTYSVTLPSGAALQAGNYFTIYDFNGLVPGATGAPAGWTLSTPMSGPALSYINIPDDSSVANLVWTYTGPVIPAGRVQLGEFWATSLSGSSEEGVFVGHNTRAKDRKPDTNVTETRIPVPAPPGVPEPNTLVLAGIGLSAFGLFRRARRT